MSSPSNSAPLSQQHLGNQEPAVANRFIFTVEGREIGVFREVSGLELQVGTVPIPEGGQNHYTLQVPGRITWPNIILKAGLTESNALFEWVEETSGVGFSGKKNQLARTTGAITAVAYDGTPLRAWNFLNVFPVKWTGPTFSVNSSTTLEETLEIVHQGFTTDLNPSGQTSS